MKKLFFSTTLIAAAVALTACGGSETPAGPSISPQQYTDSLFAVMKADRTNYTALVVDRLGPAGVDAIKPNEHWEDIPNGTLLPAQMFRAGAEAVAEMTDEFTYSLQSIWPVNPQNAPATPMEKEGLEYIAANPGENFYGTEELGGVSYYTAVYPDVAVTPGCVNCHNGHKDSPRDDFELGEVMGGVVIRVPLD